MAGQRLVLVLLGIVGVLLLAGVAAVLVLPIQPRLESPPPQQGLEPSKVIELYMGEVGGTTFAFGLNPENLTSPGPVIRIKDGEIVKIVVRNVGKIPHSFAIVPELDRDAQPLFQGAFVGTGARPVPAGEEGETIFKVIDKPGRYYYICTVPGHLELGMWGVIVVEE